RAFRGDSMRSLSSSMRVCAVAIALSAVSTIPGVASKASKTHANMRHARPLHGPNAIQNGMEEEGDDDTAIAPTLSALCQDFLGQPNPYANPAPNVDQIVGDAITQAGSQMGCPT